MSSLERVAVLGASGWVGRTACSWLASIDTQFLLFAGSNRTERIGTKEVAFQTFDLGKITDFKPTMVIDAAFITREKVSTYGLDSYVNLNESLIQQALQLQRLPYVEKFIGVSSGASVPHLKLDYPDLHSDPYGALKASYEKKLLENSDLRLKTTVARIWSVSGDLVTKPTLLAFSAFVQQALLGHINIRSKARVFRRYVDLEDFLKVVSSASPNESRVIDSGGMLVELEELAQLIFATLQIKQSISRELNSDLEADRYYSDNSTWLKALQATGHVPLSLQEQIAKVAAALHMKP
jgi:nucleoside-diphosphate-sugar epimerase